MKDENAVVKSPTDVGDEDNDNSISAEELWKEREEALLFEDEEGFDQDIQLMESLFDNPKKRHQKLLAVFDKHTAPVNCVRWNNIGTLFASAADDGCIMLWEYVGETILTSAFQRSQYDVEAKSSNMRNFPDATAFEDQKLENE